MNELLMQRGLLALITLQVLLNLPEQPGWVTAIAFALLGWRYFRTYRPQKLPGGLFKAGLTAIVFVLVFRHYRSIFQFEPASSLLILLTALKSFEVRSQRDGMILIFMCYFLILPKVVESQTILVTVIMLADVLLITSFLAYYHEGRVQGFGFAGKRAFSLSLQALPIVLIMFFVFPRFSVNIFPGVENQKGESGFSEHLSPGDISQLVLDGRTAFRVQFNGQSPTMDKMYWRGGTLDVSQGLEWKPKYSKRSSMPKTLPTQFDYKAKIYMEPENTKWMFALDWPQGLKWQPAFKKLGVRHSRGGHYYRAYRPLRQPLVYESYALAKPPASKVAPASTRSFLQLPDKLSDRTKELAANLKGEGKADEEVVQAVLDHFSDQKFTYSLRPGLISGLDDFLFEVKNGFCEHYAAAMATLLRSMGIPSRVVIGFHGGRPSLLDDYLLVTYQDAHAWLEYFDTQRLTWVRADPTSVVAPERLSLGAFEYFNETKSAEQDGGGLSAFSTVLTQMWFQASMVWDQAEMTWTRFLLDFDQEAQQDFLKRLGFGELGPHAVKTISLLTLLVVLFGIWYLLRLQRPVAQISPALEQYRKFCEKLEKRGVQKNWNEGPVDFGQRVEEEFPEKSAEIKEIISLYIQSEYGCESSTAKIFKEKVRRF